MQPLHIEQVRALIKAQTDLGISLHQPLTTAFDSMTILHQSQQFRVPGSSLQQQGRVDTTQSLSEHEGLDAVRLSQSKHCSSARTCPFCLDQNGALAADWQVTLRPLALYI
jgi:hypothetical protein